MSDLLDWLRQHNPESLAEQDVDLDILPDLTDDALREIGLSLGARKRLRAALDGGYPRHRRPLKPPSRARPSGGT